MGEANFYYFTCLKFAFSLFPPRPHRLFRVRGGQNGALSIMETDEEMLPPGVDDSAPPGDLDHDSEDGVSAAKQQQQQQQQQSAQIPLSETLVELLNQTSLMQSSHRQSTTQRLANLKKVQDIILNKDPTLLDSFSEEMAAYQHDNAPEIRRFVVAFLEAAALQDNDFIQ